MNHNYTHITKWYKARLVRPDIYTIKIPEFWEWNVPSFLIEDSLDRAIKDPDWLDNIIDSLFYNWDILAEISESEVRLIIKEHVLPLLSQNNNDSN